MLHRYISVDFVPLEYSKLATDILRMNDSFHTRERYDSTVIAVTGGFVIGRLVSVLEVAYSGQQVQLALMYRWRELHGQN